MSDKKNKVPQIRFEDFDELWEKCKLSNILQQRKVNAKITEDTPLLAFAAGQGVIDRSERKTNNRDFLTKDSSNKNYLLTKYNDIVYNPSNLKYGAIDRNKYGKGLISPIYVTFETNEEPSFIELLVTDENFKQKALQYEEGTVTKRQSVKPESLLLLDVFISPTKVEQQKIGLLFKQINETIVLCQRKFDLFTKLKQSYLKKMFPKNGEKVPEIRFGGFTKDWESCSLKKLLIKNSKKNKDLTIENVESISNKTGFTKQTIQFDNYSVASDNLSNYYIIDEEMFAYNPSRINVGSIAYKEKDEDSSIVSPLYVSFSTNDKVEDSFLWFWFKTASFEQQRQRLAEGGVRDTLSFNQLILMNMLIPQREEQQKIGIFFKQLDETIAFQKKELDQLKLMKAVFLQKMFT